MRKGLALLVACLLTTACGGGSGGGDPPASTPTPIGETPAPTPNPTPDPPSTPEPTPEPPPAPNPPPETPATPKSAKRGVAYDLADPSDLAALAPGVSWWYRWALKPSASVPADYQSRYGMDFIPMLWNGNFNAAEVETFLGANPQIRFLLLLNEPNLTDQANLTPQQAAQLWPRYETVAANTGVQLVGPAMTWGTMPGFADPVVWLDAFYAAYRAANGGRDPRIDYLAFHWYDYGLNAQLDRLTKYGKPFWVTEFANWHSGNDGAQIDSVAKQKAQMTEMVAICESRNDVFRYAWFTGRWDDEANRHTSLLGRAGELTELGQHYLAQPYWVGTWITPQASNKVTSLSFDQRTLRQVVRTSIAGSAARIRLSNTQGSEPVSVSNVHIAVRSSDASIDARTDQTITFGGQASVTLPPGTEVFSDTVAFSVPAHTDVAISFYLRRATVVTGEGDKQQLTYVAAGNVSGSPDIAAIERLGGHPLLASLDVQGEALRGSVATIGGSITAGVGIDDVGQSWPDVLSERLVAANIHVGVLKQQDEAEALDQPNLRWAIYSDLPADALRFEQPTYEQAVAPLRETISRMRQQKVKVFCSTLTPYEGHPSWNAASERVRQMYNAAIRGADSGCDAVIDQDRALRDPAQPTKLLPMFDSGDHLHPNAAGHRAIAEAIELNAFLAP
ncbi:hypothetical protein JM946_27705 [Steroidobacter sp. S1-65]|uniref:Asl1-like glycosyl hydrolase catalytic domain-containing protein n=1 Tax=Steroidobacter gossypii TaxID=2805490 RepID=A0ABS1X5N1_9GAMM|nr:glycosyl hydrolase [Steroidobacter gossypii]MBM0108536.1 hypothetical protein [Steroidobacter gossypii]